MSSLRSPQDTIVASATPPGEGGVGVIRVSGGSAIPIIASLFRPYKGTLAEATANPSAHVGLIQAADETSPLDHVVVTVFRAPQSYTGEDVVEISAHGSPYILDQILRRCLSAGARGAEPGEFTERAFLNGKIDLTQAEAVAELIHAKTEKSRAAAMAQLEGGLAKEVRRLRDLLLPLLAHIEVGLDHSDEDHDFLQRDRLRSQCSEVQAALDQILESARIGKILRCGLRVALVGRPNVGKSSLLNALLKENRAIVTPIAGTTRDTLEEVVNWNGLPVVLTDTAGLRATSEDPIERLGMERSRRAMASADVLLGMLDISVPLSEEDRTVIDECVSKPHLWVMNKTDLPAAWSVDELHNMNGRAAAVAVSAKTREGLSLLVEAVKRFAEDEKASASHAQWMLNARHQAALERARESLRRAGEAARDAVFEECVALELQSALGALGEIIGETATEELLGQIFSQFCVGK